jgi:hypothetical protein
VFDPRRRSNTPKVNAVATAEIGPNLHNPSTSVKAVSTPIGSLHRSPDLMAKRFFEQIAGKTSIFSPRPKCRSQSMWRDWASALGIDPTNLARFVGVHVLQRAHEPWPMGDVLPKGAVTA